MALAVSLLAALTVAAGDARAADRPRYGQAVLPGLAGFVFDFFASPALVDLDADGDLDAVVGSSDGGLRYARNTGTSDAPLFLEMTGADNPFAAITPGFYSAPALADLDGDGDLDAVVGQRSPPLRYLENTGTSSVAKFVEVTGAANPFEGFPGAAAPELADADGDGDQDAVLGDFSGPLRYFRNTGTSSAPTFLEVPGSASPFPQQHLGFWPIPDLADVDGDGDLDAFVGHSGGGLSYLRNTGSSSAPAYVVAAATDNPLFGAGPGFYLSPDLVDMDGDGDLDAVMGRSYGTLLYFRNTGTTAAPAYIDAAAANPFGTVDPGFRSAPELGDLDDDGDADALVGDHTGAVFYFRNTGGPRSPRYVQVTGTGNPLTGLDVGDASTPALADLDGDGDLEAVVGSRMNGVAYLRNTGTPAMPSYQQISGTANPFAGIFADHSALALADLDGDGDLDAVLGWDYGTLRFLRNTGSSTAPAYVEQTGTGNPFAGIDVAGYSAPELVDLDQDGDLDLVVGSYLLGVSCHVNTGSPVAPAYLELTGSANPFAGLPLVPDYFPALADLDGDGDLDAVLGSLTGSLTFLLGRGDFFADGFESGDTSAWSVTVP